MLRKIRWQTDVHASSPSKGIGVDVHPYPEFSSSIHSSSQNKTTTKVPLIFIIDDSQTVRKIVEICLRREGYNVQGFGDGVEAIQWLREANTYIPDVIFVDIGLPKMDGYEVVRRLRAKPQLAETAIIMLSRRDGVIDRLKARLVGAKDYITKPFQTHTIISIVHHSITQK